MSEEGINPSLLDKIGVLYMKKRRKITKKNQNIIKCAIIGAGIGLLCSGIINILKEWFQWH
jgi:hypothetical protein